MTDPVGGWGPSLASAPEMTLADALPTGIITFLFTDIEGSTAMVQRLGRDFEPVLEDHDAILRSAITGSGGVVVRTEGDAFFAVFLTPGDCVEAAATAQRGLLEHPWPEGGIVRVRMGAHTGEGRLGGGDYVGIDVHRAARIAAAGHGGQILVSATTRALVPGPAEKWKDLGSHRLADLDEREHIYQLVLPGTPNDFPPLRTDDIPTDLPTPSSAFVGRSREIDQILRLLESGRIVTLTGAGGTGKTRLAIEVAERVVDRYPGGVFFVPLDTVGDPARVPGAIARALGAPGDIDPMEAIQAGAGREDTLLVLDNLEHLTEAARDLAGIVTTCPTVSLLVTSQTRLRIRGEQMLAVPPLGLPERPDRTAVEQSDSGALFVRRAREVDPSFELDDANAATVAAIVERLDGLALALELAAARTRLFGLAGLLTELESRLGDLAGGYVDAPDRHRTLSAAVDWSYELLTPFEQSVLRAASVFVGGFSLDAMRAVWSAAGDEDPATALESLIDKSLVRSTVDAGRIRCSMLETIRAFCQRRLDEVGETDRARRAHAEYFTEMIERSSDGLVGHEAYATIGRLADERGNIAAAMEWSAEREPDLGLAALPVLARLYAASGSLDEGRSTADRLLRAGARATPGARLRGLLGAASIAYWLLDYTTAESSYLEAIDLAEQLGDAGATADAMFGLAYTLTWLGRLDEAESMADRATVLAEDHNDTFRKVQLLSVKATCAWIRGDLTASMDMFADVLRMSSDIGDVRMRLSSELVLAGGLVSIGRHRDAAPAILDLLERNSAVGDDAAVIETLDYLAVTLAALVPRDGVRLGGAIRAITDRRGGTIRLSALGIPDPREIAASWLDSSEIERIWSEGGGLDLGQSVALAGAAASRARLEARPIDADRVMETFRAHRPG